MSAQSRVWAATAGVVSVGAALALAELIALMVAPQSSPLLAVGSLVIDLAPPWAKDTAIALFGTNDKIFLLVLLSVLLALVAAGAGILHLAAPPGGVLVLGVLGAIAALAVTTRAQATGAWVIPTVLGITVGCLLLHMLIVRLRRSLPNTNGATASPSSPSRRGFVALLAGSAAAAIVVGVGSRLANAATITTQTIRRAITLPKPTTPAAPVPAGASLDVEGISTLITANENFYRIDTALQVPAIDPETWRLRIVGMVENEIEIGFDEMLALPLDESITTLMCVSNEVGGSLIGNALWLGYPIRDLLARARPLAGADMVLSRSVDGFTASTPLEILQEEDRNAIFAVGMNGEPLPPEHGFPVRMVVPGLYGYVSATKWVTQLEVTTFDQASAYWTDRGWSERGPVKTGSRIDVPANRASMTAGSIAVAGVAWAQHTGIRGVQVRVDGGDWQDARLATAISSDTWVQWVYQWDAAAGTHEIEVRATDADGQVQSGDDVPVVPNGAEGWHSISVTVG
ncbi:oxidoreductase [Microbacterium oleivorans]|uniref:molybdopterin-dependent oxidoreductase n=1 Tax=Microbacterium oleivorans TaxID=273677 RepID=UPI0010A3BDF2|nr:molybdopterin-dependent oxidoreductase [Microbacterium oleivorans]THE08814.1 oxidoreductase [Microbacterium oleivorans]